MKIDMMKIKGENLTVAYGDNVVLRRVNFEVKKGDIFIIMGGSGCGKSSLLKVLTGLKEPAAGKVLIDGVDFYAADTAEQKKIMRNGGILYQSGE